MKNFNFIDYQTKKYTFIGEFHEGLAIVWNEKGLMGFINKKGEEVIPCIYKSALPFSEGLAAVEDNKGLGGFIDKRGKAVIACQFKQVAPFSEGLAAFRTENNLWGFIDKEGKQVIPPKFTGVYKFKNGYAICKNERGEKGYLDKEGNFYGGYEWNHSFNEELTHARITSSKNEIALLDKNLNKISSLNINSLACKELFECFCGLCRVIDNSDRHGFIAMNFNKRIPCIFYKARAFSEGLAIVEPTPATIGFTNTKGVTTSFSKETHYKKINDFSCGLAAVQNISGLWGYIDQHGKEVIPCQFIEADDFSENLAGVVDASRDLYYINKKGQKKLEFPATYRSILETPSKNIFMESPTQEALAEKKRQILKLAQEEIIEKINLEATTIESEIESDVYYLSKSKKA